jgi:hypothetical protein
LPAEKQGKRGAVKWAVLEQLGRIARDHGEEKAREFALELCRGVQSAESPPTVKAVAEMLRRWRLPSTPVPDPPIHSP